MIDRLETSTSSSSNPKAGRKISIKKSLHDDHSDGSISLTSSPPGKRIARRDYEEKSLINGTASKNHDELFSLHKNDSHDEVFLKNNSSSNGIKLEYDKNEIASSCRRTASGTNVSLVFLRLKKIV